VALVTATCRGPGLDRLHEVCDVHYEPWLDATTMHLLDPASLAARIDELGATVVVAEADPVKGEVLDRPLRVIGSTRGDPTNVDVAGATERGIPVLRTPGRNADAVAELTVALLFAVTRGIVPADADLRADRVFVDGTIPYQRYRAWQVAGQTVGIIGLGAVGRAAKWRFEGLGMNVVSFDPYSPEATHASLDEMLPEADVVSMHAAPTPETFGLMSGARFRAMKPGSVYLNSARAALHDLDGLVAALESGHLAGAGLDHFDGERLPAGHPLLGMRQVVLTPHIGGATYDTEANHTAMVADDIARLFAGERPLHCVNPETLP
jgi:D-3-phosphoglycerate dehydrogenase